MYERCENVILRKVHDTFFLIDITDNYMTDECVLNEINEIGVFIWNMLSNPVTIDDIVCELKKQLNEDIEYEVLYNDISDYIQYLLQLGLAKECEA